MDALFSDHLLFISVLLIAAWTVIMSLKAIGRDVEHAEALHRLKQEASALQIEYRRRLRQRVEEARRRMEEADKRRAARKAVEQRMREDNRSEAASPTDEINQAVVEDSLHHHRSVDEPHAMAA